MSNKFRFTFNNLRSYLKSALENGYHIVSCEDYVKLKKEKKKNKILVLRVDIDQFPKKAKELALLFLELNINATFFIRLHCDYYNPFSFENYKIIKFIKKSGFEIGYHSEIIDESVIWNEPEEDCFLRDINIFNEMFSVKISGVASHGGSTGLNNLDFWKNRKPSEFGLLYEAYDSQPEFNLFNESFYISDSCWTHWKCYNHGKLVEGDNRTPDQHFNDNHKLIYLLIHSETYYHEHFYE